MSMYPDYYGDFYSDGYSDFGNAAVAEGTIGLIGVVMGVLVIVYLLLLAYTIVAYVLGSLGMHTMAKRRGIHHPWLAWIPIANVWTLGSISDQYQYVAKGRIRNRRKVLLGLSIANAVLSIPYTIITFASTFSMMEGLMNGTVSSAEAVAPVALQTVLSLAVVAVSLTQTVFAYIAYYDLFASSKPNSAVAFLVLGILFSFLLPFFVFACRKHDQGMPPRKPVPAEPQPAPDQNTWQPPVLEPAVTEEQPPAEEELSFREPEEEVSQEADAQNSSDESD